MLSEIWTEFLNIANQEVGSRVVETWLKAVTLVHWDAINNIIYIKAPNAFVKDWISTNYTRLFTTHLQRLLHVDVIKLVFVSDTDPIIASSVEANHNHTLTPSCTSTSIVLQEIPKRLIKNRCTINKHYQFNTFVVGPSNSLAFAAAHAVTEKPGQLYNPLFIYGESGLGKTHLLHAIGNEIKNNNKKAEILYQTTDRFVNEFIHAIRYDKVHQFQSKYKNIDVLLIDDVQFISNKEQTQEAFFHIFNSLYESHKQIVFSSDSYPADIKGLADRLSSRLECGLVTDIQVPTIETKIAILRYKADLSNVLLPNDVAEFIASRVHSNIRELEGALIRVIAFSSLTQQNITLDLAKKVLLRNKEQQALPVTSERILSCVAHYYHVSVDDLRSNRRHKQLSLARQVAMYFIKKFTHKTLHEIGYSVGRKDHSTVIHALHKMNEYMNDQLFAEKVHRLEQEIKEI